MTIGGWTNPTTVVRCIALWCAILSLDVEDVGAEEAARPELGAWMPLLEARVQEGRRLRHMTIGLCQVLRSVLHLDSSPGTIHKAPGP